MTITERMTEVKNRLIESERDKALSALTEMIHSRITPRVAEGDSYPIFNDESQIEVFCSQSQVEEKALLWVLDKMREEKLLTASKIPVVLTPLGISKLC
ncbi:hypothetical protein FACS1894216_01060 [Synergistales bacterium]|nr:hypothetical protein FACS1894216_01060 [Synergistales bacterium]